MTLEPPTKQPNILKDEHRQMDAPNLCTSRHTFVYSFSWCPSLYGKCHTECQGIYQSCSENKETSDPIPSATQWAYLHVRSQSLTLVIQNIPFNNYLSLYFCVLTRAIDSYSKILSVNTKQSYNSLSCNCNRGKLEWGNCR